MSFKDGTIVEVIKGHKCWIGKKMVVGKNGWPQSHFDNSYCATCSKTIWYPKQEIAPLPHAMGAGLPIRWLKEFP